jgi:hypothetical protein
MVQTNEQNSVAAWVALRGRLSFDRAVTALERVKGSFPVLAKTIDEVLHELGRASWRTFDQPHFVAWVSRLDDRLALAALAVFRETESYSQTVGRLKQAAVQLGLDEKKTYDHILSNCKMAAIYEYNIPLLWEVVL